MGPPEDYVGASVLSLDYLLGLLFIALKLTGNITWSWWWVLSPFWIPLVVGIVLLLVAAALGAFK